MHELDIPAGTAVVALDPGLNVGVACLDAAGALLSATVVTAEQLVDLRLPAGVRLVCGDGTGSAGLLKQLGQSGLQAELTDETGTSLEGRSLYWLLNPPKGLSKLLPAGLRPKPADLDAWAAYAIGRRFLGLGPVGARDLRR